MKSIFKIEAIVMVLIASLLLGLSYLNKIDMFVTYGFVFLYGAYLLGRYTEKRFYNKQ